MDPQAVLAKTALGVEKLNTRDHDLSRTLRYTLILVDGHSTVAELEKKGAVIPEFAASLRELVSRGLVAPRITDLRKAAVARIPAGTPLQAALVSLAESILGERSAKVVRKIEEAGASREDLSAAVDACFKLIRLTIDESQAEEFRDAAREVLNRGS